MIRLQINPAYLDLLQANGLHHYSAIMQTTIGETVEENESRDVRRLLLDNRTFYLKRTRFEKASSAWESYARGRRAHSKPYREMLQFRQLAARGFDVAEVVGVGEALRFGIPQRGFIITAEVSGEDLAVAYETADNDHRRRMLSQFGALLGHLHDQGFFGSTRLKDIIYDADGPRLTLIDRETRNPYPKRATARRIVERLLFNIRRQTQQGEIFSEQEWQAFCQHYCRALHCAPAIHAEDLLPRILELQRRGAKPAASA